MVNYFSLQNYTTYSILSGIKEPKDWVSRALELGHKYIGVCEKGNMSSLYEFQKECKDKDITPIMGIEMSVYDSILYKDRQDAKHIGVVLLYIKNQKGFENLITLNNISQRRAIPNVPSKEDEENKVDVSLEDARPGGFYYRGRIDIETISKYSEGLVCVVPSIDGVAFKNSTIDKFKDIKYLLELKDAFGDDFYIGFNPMVSIEDDVHYHKEALLSHHLQESLKFVPLGNTHYPLESQASLYPIVRALDRNSGGNNKNAERDLDNAHLVSNEEFLNHLDGKYEDHVVESLFNSLEEITKKCEFKIDDTKFHLPILDVEVSVKADLLKWVGIGFKEKLCPEANFDTLTDLSQLDPYKEYYPHEQIGRGEPLHNLDTLDVYIDRIREELQVVEDLDYLGYFFVVSDLCYYIDSIGEERGFARGSAGGSLLSYLLNITVIDPIRENLSFPRFLNKYRQEAPDIDLDFSSSARDAAKLYLKNKYGFDCFANISAFDRLKIPSAIKKVAAAFVYGIPSNKLDSEGNPKIVKYDEWKLKNMMKKTDAPATARGKKELDLRIESSKEFERFCKKHSNWIEEVILPLCETITNTSVHASGHVVTPRSLDVSIPCWEHSDGYFITQWKDRHCEDMGIPKYDLLTVNGVSVVGYAKSLIEKKTGKKFPPVSKIPRVDRDAAEVFVTNKVNGVFQMDTYSERTFGDELYDLSRKDWYLTTMLQEQFDWQVARIAVCRTGPMEAGAHKRFAKLVNREIQPQYDHEDLIPILKSTYGELIYQEQMMQIAVKIGGLNQYEADFLRKACGKKKLKEMVKWEDRFKEGGLENGYDKEMLDRLWSKIVAFAEYSFNLSHSVAYALLSYYQAYIKSRYPLEFWCGVLKFASSDVKDNGNIYKIREVAEREGIKFVFPNIYGFSSDFAPAGENSIYWPLRAISGIGEATQETLTENGQRTSFDSFEDFLENNDHSTIHWGVFKDLIKAGFFDPVGHPRDVLEMYSDWRDAKKGTASVEIPFELDHKSDYKWTTMKNAAYNMQVDSFKSIVPFHHKIFRCYPEQLKLLPKGTTVLVGGIVEDIQHRTTRNGGHYGIVYIKDLDERYKIKFWSNFWDDKERIRSGDIPVLGDVIEVMTKKDVWSPKDSDYEDHYLSVGDKNTYFKKIWYEGMDGDDFEDDDEDFTYYEEE